MASKAIGDEPRRTPARTTGQWLALALAIAVHIAFVAVLVFSLRWQNRKPEPLTAELYAPAPKAPVVEQPPPPPPPSPEPPREAPPLEIKPAPAAPPLPKPEPKVETPDDRAADIARKAREEEERKKREQAVREKKEAEAREAEKKREEADRRMAELREAEQKRLESERRLAQARERQAREADALKAQAEREQAMRVAQQKSDERARAEADYVRRIQQKVKGNVILPPDMIGNPEAIFEVVQLPTGEIIDVALRKSSGARAYDDAVQRAILKSSPLPRPDSPDLFQRTLTLKFRPLD
jgi:colicin import membrane protein